MEDLKHIIAQNIVQLRKKSKLTQAELAERLNYSDKAISKWERGESIPDVAVLKPFTGGLPGRWLTFVYAVPVSFIVWLVFNSIWFNRRRNFLIISLLMWSVLAALYLTFLVAGSNYWLLFAIGVPGQVIILLWSGIRLLPAKKQ